MEGNGVVRLHDTELSPSLPDPIEGRASGCPSNDAEAALGMVFDLDAWELEGEFRCKLCPVQTYMNREVHASTSNMLTSCFPCPEGTANDQQGQESCAVCLASLHRAASADATTCECAETWATDSDTELCTCPAGYYQQATICVPCEPGTSKESLGEDEELCIAEDTTLVEGFAAGGAVLGAVLLLCLGFMGFRKVRTYFELQREIRKRMRATVLCSKLLQPRASWSIL